MNKLFSFTFLLLFSAFDLFSQRFTEDFKITLPEEVITNSLYKSIKCIDLRLDTTSMGIVQLGAFNKKARVVPKIPFPTQLTSVLNSLIDSTAKNGELLFQLRQLNFAEITGAVSEKGYCFIRAGLYTNTNGIYQKLHSIDTVIFIKSMDVTRALFRNGSKVITNFIAASLLKQPTDSNYFTLTNILKIDSIEKRKIKVYNTPEYADGLYENYISFMNQIPDKQITVEMKGKKISMVKTVDEKGKTVRVKAKDIYSIVYNGQAFIATKFEYYPLQKINDDLWFTGKAKVNAKAGDVIAASFFFGLLGGLIASDSEASFEMKIDHINGGFIHVREISSTKE